jgi:hypothetical protein
VGTASPGRQDKEASKPARDGTGVPDRVSVIHAEPQQGHPHTTETQAQEDHARGGVEDLLGKVPEVSQDSATGAGLQGAHPAED